ncbi:MAG TPA: PAS domain-containing protein, partial [Vicinamibacterales bacterium]
MPRLLLYTVGQQAPFALLVLGALQVLGPVAALVASIICAAARWLDDSKGARPLGQRFLAAATVVLATQVAAVAYVGLGGPTATSLWPERVLPIVVAAVALALIEHGATTAIAAFVTRQAPDASWRLPLLRSCATVLGGAGVVTLLIELFTRQQWDLLLVAVASMAVAVQAFVAHADRLHAALRRYSILDSIDEGVAVLAEDGTVTFWNDALERITGRPRHQAIGCSL